MRMTLKGKSPTIVSHIEINMKILIKIPCYHSIERCDGENHNFIMNLDTNTKLDENSNTL